MDNRGTNIQKKREWRKKAIENHYKETVLTLKVFNDVMTLQP